MNNEIEFTLTGINAALHPPSEACLRFMAAHGFDPHMPVFQAAVSTEFMLNTKVVRPDVANIVQLLFGPFGIVAPPGQPVFRVAELQVGDNVLDVEAEYEYPDTAEED
jgi:hypothetical protein